MTDAPSCPISIGQIGQASFRQQLAAFPKPALIKDLVNKIPPAHDLPSVITAINHINNIVTLITRGEPQVNNTYVQGQPSVILKGDDFNPHYTKEDWVLEGREYVTQKLKNPDNEDQYIEIKTLKLVVFFNSNDSSRLNYDGPLKRGSF
jgi:hypothetical protein